MKRHLLCSAVLTLAAVVLFALPDITGAGSVHSGGFQSARPSTPAYVPSFYAVPTAPLAAPSAENDYAYGSPEEMAYNTAHIRCARARKRRDLVRWHEDFADRKSAFVREPADPTGSGLRL